MSAVLVALVLAQSTDLFGGGTDEPPPVEQPPPVKRPRDDGPLVIPPADGPVPDGVPKGEDPAPLKPPKARPPDHVRKELQLERQRLLDTMPSFAPPALLGTGGGLVLLGGIPLLVTGLESAFAGRIEPGFVVGTTMVLLGLAGFIFGFMWGHERSLDREPFEDRIEEIEQELGW